MGNSQRERLLLTIVPALFLLIGWFGFLRPTTELARVSANLDRAKKEAASEVDLQGARQRLVELHAEDGALREEFDQLQSRWMTLRNSANRTVDAASELRKLSEILLECRLTIIREERLEKSALTGNPLLDALKKSLVAEPAAAKGSESSSPVMDQISPWGIEFTGSFQEVRRALAQMRNETPRLIPLRLTLGEAKTNSSRRNWYLVVGA